jgi:hypothetical protein
MQMSAASISWPMAQCRPGWVTVQIQRTMVDWRGRRFTVDRRRIDPSSSSLPVTDQTGHVAAGRRDGRTQCSVSSVLLPISAGGHVGATVANPCNHICVRARAWRFGTDARKFSSSKGSCTRCSDGRACTPPARAIAML